MGGLSVLRMGFDGDFGVGADGIGPPGKDRMGLGCSGPGPSLRTEAIRIWSGYSYVTRRVDEDLGNRPTSATPSVGHGIAVEPRMIECARRVAT